MYGLSGIQAPMRICMDSYEGKGWIWGMRVLKDEGMGSYEVWGSMRDGLEYGI